MAKWLLLLLILSAAAWSQTSTTDKQIQTLQTQVKQAPGDYMGYAGLGSAFFLKARETGDIAYYDLQSVYFAFTSTCMTH